MQRLTDVKAKLEATAATLESQNSSLISALSKEEILGEVFHAGTLGYFAEYQQQKNHFNLTPSAGTYGYVPKVTYLFGFPRAITPGGVEMDLERVAIVTSVDGKGKDATFNFTFPIRRPVLGSGACNA